MTGERLWDQRADVPMQPASTNKVLTAAAALLTLDREARLTTTVVAGDQKRDPGLVILKGGGDPTLSAAPRGTDTWYKGAARISDLADQVRRSGIEPTAVAVDVSAYTGPDMAPAGIRWTSRAATSRRWCRSCSTRAAPSPSPRSRGARPPRPTTPGAHWPPHCASTRDRAGTARAVPRRAPDRGCSHRR